MKRVFGVALEVILVVAGVLLGNLLTQHVSLIPKWLIHLPEIDFSPEDLRTTMLAYAVACALSFGAFRFIAGDGVFIQARRTAKEVYALVVGVVAASLYLFLLTTVNFSPELMLSASLSIFALFLVAFLIGSNRFAQPALSFLKALGQFFGNLFGLLKTPAVWLVLLFAASPVVMAYKFSTDRAFADWVTHLKVAATAENIDTYGFKNALGETTFLRPIMAQFANSDPKTIYVLERDGKFYRADYPSGQNKTLLLDLTPKLGTVDLENGALGFDLHPEFGVQGSPNAAYVYVYYTAYGTPTQVNHLSRFDLSKPTVEARVASELPLIAQERNNEAFHNGGSVEFGPDGFLYLAVGEMANLKCHQRIDCGFFSGIFRIDVDQKGGSVSRPISHKPLNGTTGNYMIPLDNPFVNMPNAMEEYWAMGLRNPFRISFDPKTGDLWAGDVGSTIWEEVDLIRKGYNYQFPYIEGNEPSGKNKPKQIIGREKGPIYTYRHTALLRSAIGGIVYRGSKYPELQGQYLFSDNYGGYIFSLPAQDKPVDKVTTLAKTSMVAQRGITSLIEAPDGNILLTVMGSGDQPDGQVMRLVPKGEATPEAAPPVSKAAPLNGEAGNNPTQAKIVSNQAIVSLFKENCARCHGLNGRGDGPDSKDLGVQVPNFHDAEFQKTRSDKELVTAIKQGGGAVGRSEMMPPWDGILSEAEVAAMKDYIRRLKEQK